MNPGTPRPAHLLRFDRDRHLPFLRRALRELQDSDRAYDPRMPRGEDVVDAALEELLGRTRAWGGRIQLAEVEGVPVAYVAVYGEVPVLETDEPNEPIALLSDVLVLEGYRGRGIGRALVEWAISWAGSVGAPVLRLDVMAGNEGARSLYESMGFRPRMIQMEKRLEPGTTPDGAPAA